MPPLMIPEGCSVLGTKELIFCNGKGGSGEGINYASGGYHSEPTMYLDSSPSAYDFKCSKHSTYPETTSFLIFKFFSLTAITDETKL